MSSSINDNESGPPQFDYEQVQMFLSGYNLMQYFELFVEEGFDRLESLLEVTETDLVQMGLLQRAIANAKGIPPTVPLMLRQYQDSTTVRDMPQQNPDQKDFPSLDSDSFASSSNTQASPSSHPKLQTVSDNFIGNTSGPSGVSSAEDETAMSDTVIGLWKRKYRRHAKPDKHAPLKPPSAYVMFSNQIRSELKDHNMSFTDLAKIVGGRWKTLDRDEKEIYEANAVRARQEYAAALKEYQKTEEYRNYQAYLAEFRAKHEAAGNPLFQTRHKKKKKKKKKWTAIIVSW
ncbi:high mobility group box domain-containing protein [Radiomyces spectabilis]|uniref:high mobility group box domain-containing protein n=1 Tax=Radiomyces spectabilis TaxID=64574 RepID=UPI002220A328|nr:high mobility group box domain-containing protein [Radiomyces spectabilis]KAI8373004.1 high mobility group box domain-containing protein [Radiomyces spectabilis]